MPETRIADRYVLHELLARTGMSEVWRAEDETLERPVAVKLLAPSADQARFDREARAVASLSHPNIVQLYDYGEADGRPFMVLEYLTGGTLEDRLAGGPLPDGETQRVAGDIAAGLAYAHAHDFVHRDLKPANVLFDSEDRAKLADFGIASVADVSTLTQEGTILGTAAYISPEQASGEPATAASDVYSFGVILFRMLTGALPFEGGSPVELAVKHRTEPAPPVESVRPDAPPALAALAAASLAKDPAQRPRDGGALLAALGSGTVAETGATQILPAAAMPPPLRRRRSAPSLTAAVAALLVLCVAGVAAAYELTKSSSPAPAVLPPTTTHAHHRHRTTTGATTTAPTTTAPTTTAPTTTAPATTRPPATTIRVTTTTPTTTAPPPPTTTPPPPTTTAATTTTPTTTTTPPPGP